MNEVDIQAICEQLTRRLYSESTHALIAQHLPNALVQESHHFSALSSAPESSEEGLTAQERIAADKSQLCYPDPLCDHTLKPLSAVFESQSVGILAIQCLLDFFNTKTSTKTREAVINSLVVAIPRLEFGRKIIQYNAIAADNHIDLFEDYLLWCDRTLAQGKATLSQARRPSQAYVHALVKSAYQSRPLIREDVDSYPLGKELLGYLNNGETGICLSKESREIWELCDGKTAVIEISKVLGSRIQLPEEAFLEDIRITVSSFQKLSLLQ